MQVNNYVSKDEEQAEPRKTPFIKLMFWSSNLSILAFAAVTLAIVYLKNLDAV